MRGTLTEPTLQLTARRIDDFLKDRKSGEAVDSWCKVIWDHTQAGGEEPDWNDLDLAESYYRCREIHMKRGD